MKDYTLKIHGHDYKVVIKSSEGNAAEVEVNGVPYHVEMERTVSKAHATPKAVRPTAAPVVNTAKLEAAAAAKPAGAGHPIKSPLPGVILDVYVKEGDTVAAGQKLLMLEAMKMENVIEADSAGKVAAVKVSKGESVLEGAELVIVA